MVKQLKNCPWKVPTETLIRGIIQPQLSRNSLMFDTVWHCSFISSCITIDCIWCICLIWVSFTNSLLLSSSLITSSHLDFYFSSDFTSMVQVTFITKNMSFFCQEQFSKFSQLSSNTELPLNLDCPLCLSLLLSLITLLNSIFISS